MTVPVITPRRLSTLKDVPHAMPYQGSKRRLAHAIVALVPEGTTKLTEPFAGSAAVSIAARHTRSVKSVHIRDINAPLIELWRRVVDSPEALANEYERLWCEQLENPKAYYEQVREKFNAAHEPAHLLYLLARCVKAAVRYNGHGDFNQSADNRRLGAKPSTMRQRVVSTAEVLAGAAISCGDYSELLLTAGVDDVVYLDPPYEGVTRMRDHRYMRGIVRTEFLGVLEGAVAKDVSFILSYDGATGSKIYGDPIPMRFGLLHLHLDAGRSSQATLNGEAATTVESLYLSPALVARLGGEHAVIERLTSPERAA